MTRRKKLLTHVNLRIGLIAIALILTSLNDNAQLGKVLNNMSSGISYQSIVERMDVYLDSIKPLIDSTAFFSGAGDYKRFQKFKKLWEPRIKTFGSFEAYYQAQSQFYETGISNYEFISENPWLELGPKKLTTIGHKGIGPVEAITFFDNGTTESTRHMLVTSLMGGLYYSDNYGETWKNGGTDVHPWVQSGCGWAVFHPENHEIWYASSSGNDKGGQALWIGNGGIYRTNNAGQDWETIADKTEFGYWTTIFKIIIDPKTPQTLYAATSSGIYKTDNCEVLNPVWRKVHNGFTYDLEFKPGQNSILYATSFISNPDNTGLWKVIKSANYGEDWDVLANQPMILPNKDVDNNYITIEVSKARPDYIYCLVRNKPQNYIFYNDLSSNVGWVSLTSYNMAGDFGGGHAFGVEQLSLSTKIMHSKSITLGGVNLNGTPFSVGSPVHVDVEDVIYHPYNANEVWICTHGGVEKSTNGGQNWQAKYEGLGIAMVENFASSFSDPGVILAGLYHDGVQLTTTPYSKDWNPDWKWLSGFYVDGMMPVIDHINPDYMLGSGQKGYWLRSNNRLLLLITLVPL